jgi:hypothetical protein
LLFFKSGGKDKSKGFGEASFSIKS